MKATMLCRIAAVLVHPFRSWAYGWLSEIHSADGPDTGGAQCHEQRAFRGRQGQLFLRRLLYRFWIVRDRLSAVLGVWWPGISADWREIIR